MINEVVGGGLGFLHGMRHALEPDHVAAVSTVLAEQRSGRATVGFALAWGAGHGLTLLVVGGLLF
jgi:high-affinity nickel permease